jgi:Domain of unknown function (DUF1906)
MQRRTVKKTPSLIGASDLLADALRAGRVLMISVLVFGLAAGAVAQATTYLGFDRNDYPGDGNLKILRNTFSYTGYWLNHPPGENSNSWAGHRAAVESAGFGFLVLFNGRLYAELKSVENAARLGTSDAAEAVASARREGFRWGTIIFLDQEQGGRMLPEQKAYIYSWVDGVSAAGFRVGVYCSGIPAKDDANVVTAEDIREHAGDSIPEIAHGGARATEKAADRSARATQTHAAREIVFWAINDACPPSPGCAFPEHPASPAKSGVSFAEVWQFAQSPRRKDVAAHCTSYNRNGSCYPPEIPRNENLYIDVDSASSPDPSHGRTR